MTHSGTARRIERLAAALHLGRLVDLTARCRRLLSLWVGRPTQSVTYRGDARLADTTDDGMLDMLSRAILMHRSLSRWERAAVRATIGMHARRLRDAGATGEQGLTCFKEILHRALPPASERTAEQTRTSKDIVQWWVEAYYGEYL